MILSQGGCELPGIKFEYSYFSHRYRFENEEVGIWGQLENE